MVQRTVTVTFETGLHARPASLFVQIANRFQSRIRVSNGSKTVNGKSILSILSLAAGKGAAITIEADGPDEAQALQTLADFVTSGVQASS